MIERSRVRIPAGTAGEFSSPGSTFCADLLFRYPFHPRVTTVARKKSRSFCQKCRWQVTAKTRIHLTYVDFIEPCFGIGHNLSLICQMTSEDIKHQLIIIWIRPPPLRPLPIATALEANKHAAVPVWRSPTLEYSQRPQN